MSTAAPAKIANNLIASQRAHTFDAKWQLGFVLLGFLVAPMGAFLVYWRYYLEGEPAVAGLHFAGLNLGYLVALALPRRVRDSIFAAKHLAIFGSLLASISFSILPFLGPPHPASLRIAVLFLLGSAAGLLTLSLLRIFEPQYVWTPFQAVSRSSFLFGIGLFAGSSSIAALYLLAPDARALSLMAVAPLSFLCAIQTSKVESNEKRADFGGESSTQNNNTLATVLFRCLLLVQVGSEWALAGWLPLYLIGRAGLSPGLALLSLSFYLLLLSLLRWANLPSYLGWRAKPTLSLCTALVLFGLLLLNSGTMLYTFVLATALLALGLAPVLPLVWRDLDERFAFQQDYYRGSLAVAVTGAMTIPFLMGWVQTLFGIRYVMLIPAIGSFLALCLCFLISFESHLMMGTKGVGRSEPF